MERYEQSLLEAKKIISLADHMMSVTYKVVSDPKLLLAVMDRIRNALSSSMSSLLQYERMYKRIPPYNETYESMYHVFKSKIVRRYHVNIEYLTLLQEVDSILKEHKKSPVEFRRKDKFVICSENYRMKVVTVDNIKEYIQKAKQFIRETENMVKIDGRVA